MLQVEGKNGIAVLRNKLAVGGPAVLYHGSLAAYSATLAGHLPYFGTFNALNMYIPEPVGKVKQLMRRAAIGFSSAVVSDTVSNSIRVLKTTRQTSAVRVCV